VRFLRDQGVEVSEGARPVDSAEAHEVYLHLLRAATGAHVDDATYAAVQAQARDVAAGDRSYAARHLRGSSSTHRDWVRMDERRERLRRQWAGFFERHDLLICPVATTPAFAHQQQGERWERMIPVNGHTQPSTDALFWAGYPGLVGLPVGAQIVGPLFADPMVLRFACWLEDAYRAFVPPPMAA
jgi:amidase